MPQDSQAAPGTPTEGPLALPSFISLSSSPEEADAPDTLPTKTSQVKGMKVHDPTNLEHLRVSQSVHKIKLWSHYSFFEEALLPPTAQK